MNPAQTAIHSLRIKQAQIVANIFLDNKGNISNEQQMLMCYQCMDNLATVQNQLLLLGLNNAEFNKICNQLQEVLFTKVLEGK